MKIFNFIAPNSIPFPKLSAILYSLVLSVLLLACSPSTNDSTTKTKVTLSSSSATLNAVKDTKVGTGDKITITKKPAGATGKWSISPKLPDGLALTGDENADTATLEGTPTEISEKKKYTVTFTGSGDFGSASTTIDVYVAKAKVTLSSSSAILNAVKNIEVETADKITITKNPDGATGTWSISPKLPDGLALTGDENADTATLEGAPTESSEKKKYTVTFTGSGDFGSASTTIDVYVAKAKVTLSSSSAILNAVKDIEVDKIIITKKPDGATGKWSISPKLPDGLALTGDENADTATLEGAPTEISEEKEYTVTFTGSGDYGSASTTIDVQVADAPLTPVTLTKPAKLLATKGIEINPGISIVKTPTEATGVFSANLPAGLTIDGDTGIIKGTPEGTSTNTYEISFKGSGEYGDARTTIEIEVGVIEVKLTAPAKLSATQGIQVPSTMAIAKTPTEATGVFSANLPAGLSIDGDTGIITGTPTTTSASQTYPITFTGNGGYGNAKTAIDIEVTTLPTLSLSLDTPSPVTMLKDRNKTITITLKRTPPGADVPGTWSITTDPALHNNLIFTGTKDSATATIAGTPDTIAASREYTVTFKPTTPDDYASSTALTIEVSIEVGVLPVRLTAPAKLSATKDALINSTSAITKTPTEATGEFSANLPAGLTIAPDTGIIAGTPEGTSTNTYEISFKGSGEYGDAQTTIEIEVGVLEVSLTAPAKLSATQGIQVPSTMAIAKTPTEATGVFSANLPAGLTIDGDTGIITGTPTTTSASQTYPITFTGNGSYGNAKTAIDIEVTTPTTLSLSLDTPSPVTMLKDRNKTITITLKRTPPGADVPGTWSIANTSTLHNGLIFTGTKDSATATIAGTPDTIAASREYTVTFKPTTPDDYASSTALTIEVSIEVGVLPVRLTAPAKLSATKDALINSTSAITKTPTEATGEFSANLPAGLTIAPDTGIIAGTPEGTSTNTYEISFKGSGEYGDAQTTIEIEVGVLEVSLTAPAKLSVTQGRQINPTSAITKNPLKSTGVFSANLPAGLTIDGDTGVITGTPTITSASRTYPITFTGNGSYGNAKTDIDIEVVAAVSIEDFTLNAKINTEVTANNKITTSPAKATGTWRISPTLPTGLTLNNDGTITGTATENSDLVDKDSSETYRVTFTGTGGFGDATKDITVGVYKYQPVDKTALITAIEAEMATAVQGASADLNLIDTSAINDMNNLFYDRDRKGIDRKTFAGDVRKWDVSKVTTMASMFRDSSFDNDISGWDVSAVKSMAGAFLGTPFNQDISSWDVSAVTEMSSMFQQASSFNQNLNLWTDKIGKVNNMLGMFYNATKFSNKGVKMTWDVTGKITPAMFEGTAINDNHKPTGL